MLLKKQLTEAAPLPYIDFYKKHKISPVTKGIDREQEYFAQRKYLYRLLGVGKSLAGQRVLEFGPGNGINAIYTNSLSPDHYTLVDGNPLAIENIQKNFSSFYSDLSNIEITTSLIQDFPHAPTQDLVLCENLIPNQLNPTAFTQVISQNVALGGRIIFTCNDHVSNLSETLRTLVGLHLAREIEGLKEKADYLSSFFSIHVQALKHVTRSLEDWIIDNILNLEWSIEAPLFSMAESVDALGEKFLISNSSPCILNDLRWYRSVFSEEELFKVNQLFKNSYFTQMANLLDYRMYGLPHDAEIGKVLLERAQKIRKLCREYIHTWDLAILQEIAENLLFLAEKVSPLSPITASSLRAYATMLRENDYAAMSKEEAIISWWGRGTQYVSFVRELI